MKTKELQQAICNARARILGTTSDDVSRGLGSLLARTLDLIARHAPATLLLTIGFVATVSISGVVCAYVSAYWFWKPSGLGLISSPDQAFSFGLLLVLLATTVLSVLFGFVVLIASLLVGGYGDRPVWRFLLYGCLWGFVVVDNLIALLVLLAFRAS
jgi:hypothetical protein